MCNSDGVRLNFKLNKQEHCSEMFFIFIFINYHDSLMINFEAGKM